MDQDQIVLWFEGIERGSAFCERHEVRPYRTRKNPWPLHLLFHLLGTPFLNPPFSLTCSISANFLFAAWYWLCVRKTGLFQPRTHVQNYGVLLHTVLCVLTPNWLIFFFFFNFCDSCDQEKKKERKQEKAFEGKKKKKENTRNGYSWTR